MTLGFIQDLNNVRPGHLTVLSYCLPVMLQKEAEPFQYALCVVAVLLNG